MASIQDQVTLRTGVADWLIRSDLTDAQIDDFISIGEARVYDELRVPTLEALNGFSVVATNSSITIPAGFLEVIELKHVQGGTCSVAPSTNTTRALCTAASGTWTDSDKDDDIVLKRVDSRAFRNNKIKNAYTRELGNFLLTDLYGKQSASGEYTLKYYKADDPVGTYSSTATTAGDFVVGKYYPILTVGNTNFIGYMDNIHIYPYAKYTEDFSQQLPILARAITSNRGGEFTVRGNALWAGAGDDITLADTGFVNRTGEDTTGDGIISVVIDSPQTVNSTAFMVPVIFKNTSDVQLTLNYNMGASVRANTATDDAATSRMTYYGNRGVWAGGGPSISDVIDYFTIGSVSETALDFGNLSAARWAMSSASSGTRALFAGGLTPTVNVNIIEYITVASTGNATDFGDTSTLRKYPAGTSDGNRAVFMGGENPTAIVDTMDFITMTVSGNATDFGENTQARLAGAATSNGSRACYIAGESPTKRDTIDYITIGTIGDATDFGEITVARAGLTGLSDGSRGIVAGGSTGSVSDVIDYFNMASLGIAADYGNLATGTNGVAGSSNGSRGVVGMGATPGGGTHVDTVNYFPIGTLTATATDFGELSVARAFGTATSGD